MPLSFGSEDYFALIAARPEWGRYFALGDHIIVVLEGTAYEARLGDAPPVEVPDSTPAPTVDPAAGPTPTPESPAGESQNLGETLAQIVQALVGTIVEFFAE
ncbi:hypothetical protein ACFLYD_06440 [Chloroflexota bacterium]